MTKEKEFERNPISALLNWPKMAGQPSETTTRHDNWIQSLATTIKFLTEKISTLEMNNAALKLELQQVKEHQTTTAVSKTNTSNSSSWSEIVANPKSTAAKAIAKVTEQNNKMQAIKATRVVIYGLLSTQNNDDDKAAVKGVIEAIKTGSTHKIVHKLPASLSASADSLATQPIVVQFEDVETRNSILAAAKNLSKDDDYRNKVFVSPDRTPSEIDTFSKLNKNRKKYNDALDANKVLNQPFRFVIRGGRLKCINTQKTININGTEKNSFGDWKEACAAAGLSHVIPI
jgi:hypothetical protein